MSLAASPRDPAPRRRSAAARGARAAEASRRTRGGAGGRGRRQLLSARLAEILSARARALTGLGLGAASILLLVALVSYDPSDPSLNTAADGGRVANLLGVVGSYMADLLIQSLGIGAFLLASLPLVWAWRLLQGRALGRGSIRVLCLALGVGFTSAAVAGVDGLQGWPDSFGLGGTMGLLGHNGIAALGDMLVGVGGSTIVSVAAGILGGFFLMLAMGLSGTEWRRVGDGLSQGSIAIGRSAATAGRLTLRAGAGAGAIAGRALGRARAEEDADEGHDDPRPDNGDGIDDDGAGFIARLLRRRPGEPKSADLSTSQRRAPAFTRDALPAFDDEDEDEDGMIPNVGPPSRMAETRLEGGRKTAPVIVPPKPAAQRRTEPKQTDLRLEGTGDYELPDLSLLAKPDPAKRPATVDPAALTRNAEMLERVLADFGVKGSIVKVNPGPVVTLYELEPAPGTKSSRVIGLADDIARSMSAVSVRVAVVPGRNVIGIELPNRTRETVYLREILASEPMEKGGKLTLGLGKDIGGHPIAADLARMPHLLVAGTTGSGKSVAINTMILSLLFRLPPDRVRFIMVDPKMLELSIYDGIPHLLAPVVTDPKKAVVALKWTVREMEDRYRAMSKLGVRNIEGYNQRLREAKETGEHLTRRVQTGFDPDTGKPVFEDQPVDLTELPYIVVVVDEMADLMLVAGKDIEAAIQRLAQMARAAGIHLIMATQRPSVDVITGTIKANFPTRISFQVTSKIDSRTILGESGAEQLLGQGDMLYMAGGGRITRIHGPFVSDQEVEEVVRFVKSLGEPEYLHSITEDEADCEDAGDTEPGVAAGASGDDLYDQAVALVAREQRCSVSFIQRHLQIGYNRSARIVERMEQDGVVSQANHVGKRDVLIGRSDY